MNIRLLAFLYVALLVCYVGGKVSEGDTGDVAYVVESKMHGCDTSNSLVARNLATNERSVIRVDTLKYHDAKAGDYIVQKAPHTEAYYIFLALCVVLAIAIVMSVLWMIALTYHELGKV